MGYWTLLEKGKTLLVASGGKDYIDSNLEELFKEIKRTYVENAYDLQDYPRRADAARIVMALQIKKSKFNKVRQEMGFQERAGKMTEEKWWKSFIRTRLKIVPSRIHEDKKEEITLMDDEKRMCANAGIPEEEWIKGKKRVLDEEAEALRKKE